MSLKNNQQTFEEKHNQSLKDKEFLSLELQTMKVEKEEVNKKLESAQAYLEEVQKLVSIQKTKNQKLLQLT